MTSLLWKIGTGVVIAGLLFGAGYMKGHSNGRVEALNATVKAYEKREGIENEISSMDRVRLCVELGGLPDECEQLRGVAEATEAE